MRRAESIAKVFKWVADQLKGTNELEGKNKQLFARSAQVACALVRGDEKVARMRFRLL